MNAFWPNDSHALLVSVLILAATLLAAFGTSYIRPKFAARLAAWMVPLFAVATTELCFFDEPAGFRMLVFIFGALFGMKGVVTAESRHSGEPRLRPLAWFAFAAAWLGMRPNAFANVPGPARNDAGEFLRKGFAGFLSGLALAAGAHGLWNSSPTIPNDVLRTALVFAMALPSLSLILHFGIINILVGAWRLVGADCRPLFRQPLRSTSLGEFWSRRWNLAFAEMAAVAVARPLRPHVGKGPALFAAFVFSGLLHEIAISLPVHAGYGLPMAYFILQGLAVAFEKRIVRKGTPIDARPWLGRLWTAAWLILPLPVLFHPPFFKAIILPLIGA